MSLKKENVQEIVKSLGTEMVKYHIFAENRLYLSHDIVKSLEHHQPTTTDIRKIDMSDYHREDEIYKILIYDDKINLDLLKQRIPQTIYHNYSVVKSSNQLLEIFHKEGSKGHALEYLSSLLSIPKDDIIAFGDEENDITMIKFAGLGVAMSNAKKIVVSAAKEVTLSNDFDGVAIAIDKYFK
jgi:Cof subfamily protein (haloacid dehalogenase superfamily)